MEMIKKILITSSLIACTVLAADSTAEDWKVSGRLKMYLQSIDVDGGTITVETATTNAFAMVNTSVLFSVYLIKQLYISQSSENITFGGKGLKGREIPANAIMRLKYKNETTDAKTWYLKLEYYYGYFSQDV